MPAHKGHKKIGGRKKGTENKTTKEAKEILNKILFAELPYIKEALAEVRGKSKMQYLDTLSKLLVFSLPKKTDLTTDDEPIDFSLPVVILKKKSS